MTANAGARGAGQLAIKVAGATVDLFMRPGQCKPGGPVINAYKGTIPAGFLRYCARSTQDQTNANQKHSY